MVAAGAVVVGRTVVARRTVAVEFPPEPAPKLTLGTGVGVTTAEVVFGALDDGDMGLDDEEREDDEPEVAGEELDMKDDEEVVDVVDVVDRDEGAAGEGEDGRGGEIEEGWGAEEEVP